MKILAITLNTFREALRNKILYSVVLFAAVIIGLATIFGSVTIGDQVKVIKDFGLFSLSCFGAILTIVSGVSLLNKELKYKTIYNILSKPISRWQFILGKHLGLTLTIAILVSLMGLGLIVFVSIFEGKIDWLLFQGILFTILELNIVSALVIFFSSIVITTTLTGLFTLGAYLAGRSLSYINEFLSHEPNSSPLMLYSFKLCDWILPDLSLFNFNDNLVYHLPATPYDLLAAITYSLSYSAILIILASLIFAKRELGA